MQESLPLLVITSRDRPYIKANADHIGMHSLDLRHSYPVLCVFSAMGVFSTMGDIMSTKGDILSTMGDVQYYGGYHNTCGGYHEYHGSVKYRGNTQIKDKRWYPPMVLNTPQGTHDIPHSNGHPHGTEHTL